jgi:hypothetical protein
VPAVWTIFVLCPGAGWDGWQMVRLTAQALALT